MQSLPSTNNRRRSRWTILLLAVALGAIVLGGGRALAGPSGGTRTKATQSATTLTPTMAEALARDMAAIEQTPPDQLANREGDLIAESKSADKNVQARASFLLGYLAEYRATQQQPDPDRRNYAPASEYYTQVTKVNTPYRVEAQYRLGILGANGQLGMKDASQRAAKQNLRLIVNHYDTYIPVRQPGGMEVAGEGGTATVFTTEQAASSALSAKQPAFYPEQAAKLARERLDLIYQTDGGRDATYYRIVDSIVRAFNRISPSYGAVLALIFIALVVKLITIPFTTMSFRGMRDMQRVQPLIKELQEKYKDDKQKQAEEQMKLMREHKVNPLGGCLPMLIQLPIFIVVYQAVQVYSAKFATVGFLWIPSLANPDWPLLILYAISMIVTQKLTATPAADPQQKMMQNQMTYFMPIFLVIVLKNIASAFVLYWFFLNVFSAIHQYYLMRRFRLEDEAAGVPVTVDASTGRAAGAPNRKKGK